MKYSITRALGNRTRVKTFPCRITSVSSSNGSLFSSSSKSKENHKKLVRSLYRSLLQLAKEFNPSRPPLKTTCNSSDGKLLSSILHRSGIEEQWSYDDELLKYIHHSSTDQEEENSSLTTKTKPLPFHVARDLRKGYLELQEAEEENLNHSKYNYQENESSKLFRMLLKEILSGEKTQANVFFNNTIFRNSDTYETPIMRFPSQIPYEEISYSSCPSSSSLWNVIRREFRANSNDIIQYLQQKEASTNDDIKEQKQNITIVPSHTFSDETRVQTALIAVRELNKKRVWFYTRKHKLEKKFSPIETASEKIPSLETLLQNVSIINTSHDDKDLSSYLKPGTFLVAHPLLTGYFSQTVIMIMDHSDSTPAHVAGVSKERKIEEGTTLSSSSDDSSSSSSGGGTYGLVINRPAKSSFITDGNDNLKSFSSEVSSENEIDNPVFLEQIVRKENTPKNFIDAFGKCVVREGGPVHASIQMLRMFTPEMEEQFQLGGKNLQSSESTVKKESIMSFQGDVLKAAAAVLGDDDNSISTIIQDEKKNGSPSSLSSCSLSSSNFSFVVGASCWSPDQLETELRRGYWLLANGPHELAFHADKYKTKNESSLWAQMLSALGREEGDLAKLFVDDDDFDGATAASKGQKGKKNKQRAAAMDENADVCDSF